MRCLRSSLLFAAASSHWRSVALAASAPPISAPIVNAPRPGQLRRDRRSRSTALAATGDPAAAPVLEALTAGNLYVRKSDGAVFIATKAGGNYKLIDPLTGADAGEAPRDAVEKIKVNNKLRARDPRRPRLADADEPRRRDALPPPRSPCSRAAIAEAIPLLDAALAAGEGSGDRRADAAGARRRRPQIRRARGRKDRRDRGAQAHAAVSDALAILAAAAASTEGPVGAAAGERRRIDRGRARPLGRRPERLVRPVARLGAAARRDRPRHHLRRHGRHQHGAWRDGHARRLHHLRRPGDDPRPTRRGCSTGRWRSRCRSPSSSPARSASSSSAASSASSTAGRSRRCSPPGASR